MLDLVYFAWVREIIGKDGERLAKPADVATVADLLDWLAGLDATYAEAFADRTRVRVAVNQQFATADVLVPADAEVALFPPVTGG